MAIERALVEDVASWAGEWLAFRRATTGFPGLAYAIGLGGEVLASGADGLADVAAGEEMREAHLFRIASHSKSFTATLLMQLADGHRPRLGLDDRVGDHLPELVGREGFAAICEARLEELAAHGSGISRDGVDGDYWQLASPFPDADALFELLAASPSPYGASERFHYSNLAYSLLGVILERVSDTSFGELVAERICAPLGLADTAADYLAERAGEYAHGYSHSLGGNRPVVVEHIPTNAMAPATGVTSTARDLVAFFSAHCVGNEALVSTSAKARMQRQRFETRRDEGYALGLQTLEINGRRLIGHSGGYPGHITRTWCDPRDGIVICVLTNAAGAPASALATGLFRLIDKAAGREQPAAQGAGVGVDVASFSGRFSSLWGAFDLAAFGGFLYEVGLASDDASAQLSELVVTGPDSALLAKAPDGYSSEGEPYAVTRDDDGTVRTVRGESAMTSLRMQDWAALTASGEPIRRPC